MPVRHFYLLSHYISSNLLFLFSACWLHVNECNSLWEGKGERSIVYCLLGRYICQRILLICSHITFPLVYYFYFLLAGSRGNEIYLSSKQEFSDFPPFGAKTQKKETMPYPRCGFGAGLRCG